jgi:hypothetical protein
MAVEKFSPDRRTVTVRMRAPCRTCLLNTGEFGRFSRSPFGPTQFKRAPRPLPVRKVDRIRRKSVGAEPEETPVAGDTLGFPNGRSLGKGRRSGEGQRRPFYRRELHNQLTLRMLEGFQRSSTSSAEAKVWHVRGRVDRARFSRNARSKAPTETSGEEDNGHHTHDTSRPSNIVKSLDSSAGKRNVRYGQR